MARALACQGFQSTVEAEPDLRTVMVRRNFASRIRTIPVVAK
jgi:hypothetical protein